MMFKVNVSFNVHVKAKDADTAYEKILQADKLHILSIARDMRIKVDEPGYEVLNDVR
jgi:hypothetical protein